MARSPRNAFSFVVAVMLALAVATGATAAPAVEAASPWSQGYHSRARLVSGTPPAARGESLAALQIELDRGFKTYWRHPGESGVPPTFDWSKSSNVGAIEVLWPAPRRFEDPGGTIYGYADGVLFPIRVAPKDASQPVRLVLELEYGVCKDICIPAQAHLELPLPPRGAVGHGPLIERAMARVPPRQEPGQGEDLSILAARPIPVDGAMKIAVTARVPAGSAADLFVEPPEHWFMAASRASETAADPTLRTFVIDIHERPRKAARSLPLRLTLVAGDRSIETTVTLDAAGLSR